MTMRCNNGEKTCNSSLMELTRWSGRDVKEVVIKSPPCEDVEQSKKFDYFPCCQFVREFTTNIEATMKIMKYSVQAPHFYESKQEEKETFLCHRDNLVPNFGLWISEQKSRGTVGQPWDGRISHQVLENVRVVVALE